MKNQEKRASPGGQSSRGLAIDCRNDRARRQQRTLPDSSGESRRRTEATRRAASRGPRVCAQCRGERSTTPTVTRRCNLTMPTAH
jgi:hypothetical protein